MSQHGDAVNLTWPIVEEVGLIAFVEYMNNFTYIYPFPEDGTTLELHHAAYAFGQKYECPELREKALSQFKDACARLWYTRSFVSVIRAIYDPDSETTNELRRVVVRTSIQHPYYLIKGKGTFSNMMGEEGEFVKDVAMALIPEFGYKRPDDEITFYLKCLGCLGVVVMALQ